MDKVPETRQTQPEPNIPTDAESDNPWDVVNNLDSEQLDIAWDVECQTWAEMRLNPGVNVAVDGFQLKHQLDVLIRSLSESGMLDLDEFNETVKRQMLVDMIKIRRMYSQQMLQAKLTEGVIPPSVPSDIFLPQGFKRDG